MNQIQKIKEIFIGFFKDCKTKKVRLEKGWDNRHFPVGLILGFIMLLLIHFFPNNGINFLTKFMFSSFLCLIGCKLLELYQARKEKFITDKQLFESNKDVVAGWLACNLGSITAIICIVIVNYVKK